MPDNQIVVKHPGLMLKEYFLDEMKITPFFAGDQSSRGSVSSKLQEYQ